MAWKPSPAPGTFRSRLLLQLGVGEGGREPLRGGGHYCCAPADSARGAGVEVGGAGLGLPLQVPQPWGMGRAESVRIPDVSGDNGGRQDLT